MLGNKRACHWIKEARQNQLRPVEWKTESWWKQHNEVDYNQRIKCEPQATYSSETPDTVLGAPCTLELFLVGFTLISQFHSSTL
jgi:hypothetical protein